MALEPGEEIFFDGHPSWRSMLGFHTKGVLAAVLAGTIAGIATRASEGSVSVGWVTVIVLIVFVLVLLAGAVNRARMRYTITSRRLTIETGLLARELHET